MAKSWVVLVLSALASFCANASQTSYRAAHPIGWMQSSPVGESPGWSTSNWTNFEVNHANIWNMQADFTDRRTNDIYTYKADFEQSTAVVETGFALSDSVALAFEVPYANRNGGFLDDFIDQFHVFIQSSRFLRHLEEDFGNSFVIQKNGVDQLGTERSEGVANLKAKLKYWFWQWRGTMPGSCECGLAISGQAKFPTQSHKRGLTSGSRDYSGLVHLGVPLWYDAGMWATAGFTKLGPNGALQGWPTRTWQQMYEVTFDLGIFDHLGIVFQARVESPLLDKKSLHFNYTGADENSRTLERIASGWNSLTEWRGTQTFGLRWRWGEGSQANLLMTEDWGLGNRDGRGDWNYVTNAPDVAFLAQLHLLF